ncbi:hypothetical protein LTR70_004606 [Exophiala xenobiotica]|uniref:Uncharacterized protein n=1 Tax=Lithohypha guttulata TaxID=1690604 RepID=A0ABR0KCT5_9EURO|nr:hypothetical protein LTR24_004137 [Lithohypha guttulata]KAK5320379.1 hypothetical protein LTR70_004606 [Exophiala xenobiotica]
MFEERMNNSDASNSQDSYGETEQGLKGLSRSTTSSSPNTQPPDHAEPSKASANSNNTTNASSKNTTTSSLSPTALNETYHNSDIDKNWAKY